jgi:hypothetical protein
VLGHVVGKNPVGLLDGKDSAGDEVADLVGGSARAILREDKLGIFAGLFDGDLVGDEVWDDLSG